MPDFHLLFAILCALVLDKMIERVILQCVFRVQKVHMKNYSITLPLVVVGVSSSMKVDLWQSLKCIVCP